jgi:hypothetical protein
MYNAPGLIAQAMQYDNIVMRDLYSHLLGGRPFRSLKEIMRDLQRDEDEEVSRAARELAAWRELPRASHGNARQDELVRGLDGPAEADTLLRGAGKPNPAARSLWQRLRAGIGL